ncbi:hypothetical protein D3C72_470570 [compost metagenome]
MSGIPGVTGRIRHCNGERKVTFAERTDVVRRNAYAPAAIGLHDARIVLTAQRHGNHVTFGCAARATGNNLRLTLLIGIDHVITRDGVHRHDRGYGIDAEISGGGGGISGFVVDVYGDRMGTLSECVDVAVIQGQGPCAVTADGGGVVFAVEGDRDNLPGLGVGFTAQR